jgi:RHS repeat-associated protein
MNAARGRFGLPWIVCIVVFAVACAVGFASPASGDQGAAGAAGPAAHLGGPPKHAPAPLGHAAADSAPPGREVVGRRTRTSRTWKTSDGRFFTRVYAAPVNYRDSTGNWHAIDDTLAPTSTAGYAFANRADRYRVRFPDELGARPVEVSDGGDTVGFRLRGAHGAPVASGSTARFENVMSGVSASYTAGSGDVKEDLTLADANAPTSYTYALTLGHGLRARDNRHGGVDIVGRDGSVRFSFEAPFAYDHAGARIGAGHGLSLHLAQDSGGQVMKLELDRAWLSAADRKFPVVIDPAVDVADNLDCYIVSGTSANTSFCGGTSVKVGWDGTNAYRSLMRFDVASAVPANSMVVGAHALLYQSGATTATSTSVAAYQVTHSWTSAATWNKFDGTNAWTSSGGDLQLPAEYTDTGESSGTNASWRIFGVANVVQRWLDGSASNYGLLFKEPTENVNDVLTYSSRTAASNAPYIEVVWEPKFMGDQSWYPMAAQTPLGDRSSLAVNADGGNLVVHSADLRVAGVGLPLSIDRTYNNLSPDMNAWGYGWSINSGFDMWLAQYVDGQTFFGPTGTPFRFTRNSDGSYTSPPGIDATLTSDATSNTVTYNTSGVQYVFDVDGDKLTAIKDKNGRTISVTENADYTINTMTDTEGRTVTFGYDTGSWSPRINSITDSSGRNLSYTYYPSGGPLKTFTDGAGKTTTYSYNGDGSLTQVVDGAGNITNISYDTSYRVASITRVTNNTTLTGDTTTFTYNSGNTVVTDPNGHTTTYAFDSTGRTTSVTDGLGHVHSQTWNADNQPVDFTSPVNQSTGKTDHSVYDTKNNLTSNTAPGNGSTAGASSSATFNASGAHPNFPDAATNAQGQTTSFHYDSPTAASPNLQSVSQSIGSPGVDTTLESFTYDSTQKGQIDSSTDINHNQTTYHYDASHRLDKITPPSPQGVTTLGHDSLSRVSTVQDGLLQTTTYTYDGDDRVSRIDYPDSTYVTFTYDGDGNVTQVYDSNGALTENYGYDRKSRLTSDSGATGTDTYTYDAADNRTTVTDGGGTVTYAYDAANNTCWAYVGSSTNACASAPTGATRFSYDNDDNRTHTYYPGNVDMSQVWDNGDRLKEIKAINTVGPTTLTDFTYTYTDTAGTDRDRRATVLDANNNKTTYSYDPDRGWLTEALTKTAGGTGSTVSDYKFKYDPNGNLIHRTDASGSIWTTLGYDNANQLCWKVAGNLADTGGRQPCTPTPTGATTFSYDADGQQLSQSGRGSLTWSKRHQPTSVFGSTMSYFGADATRIADGSDTFKYNAGGLGTKTTGATSAYYTRDPDGQLLSDRTTGGTYNYIFDGLGSIVALTNSSGTVSKTYSYDPYGTVTAGSGSVDNPWQYGGGYWDPAAGVEKFGQRYYDPSIARWTQPDPIDATGIQQGNRWIYAGCDPSNQTDPTGLSSLGPHGRWLKQHCDDARYDRWIDPVAANINFTGHMWVEPSRRYKGAYSWTLLYKDEVTGKLYDCHIIDRGYHIVHGPHFRDHVEYG